MSATRDQHDPESLLRGFAHEFRSRGIPPPHILLVGRDEFKNLCMAQQFADWLGLNLSRSTASKIEIAGDLTVELTRKGVAFFEGIHQLKRNLAERLSKALNAGELEFLIEQGPAQRRHMFDLSGITVIATCPAAEDCPPGLAREFRCVIEVEPYSQEALMAKLKEEAWKDRISLDPAAVSLLVRCSNGRADILLSRFRKIIGAIEEVRTTSQPHLTELQVRDALARFRIEILPEISGKDVSDIGNLSGQEFEEVIKLLLIKMGFQAEVTEVTGDGGIDIVASLDMPFCGGRYLFQCKRYSADNVVGAPAIRDFYGAVVADRATKGIFITTSSFSNQAREFAARTGVELVDLAKLHQLFAQNGLTKFG